MQQLDGNLLWVSGEEIDSGDSSQDGTPLVPQGLEDCASENGVDPLKGHCSGTRLVS